MDPTPLDSATFAARGLFAYEDGFRARLVDVFDVQARIQDALPAGDMDTLDELMRTAADAQHPEFVRAALRLAALVGVGFDLPALDLATGQGLSTTERIDLLAAFFGGGDAEPVAADPEPEPEAEPESDPVPA